MTARIRITVGGIGEMEARTNDENPQTARAVLASLPIKGNANTWGDEIYFSTSLNLNEEKSRTEVEVGSVAYWPPGRAICIFFGPTPASKHNEPRAASPVNVFAKIVGDSTILRRVRDSDEVLLDRYLE